MQRQSDRFDGRIRFDYFPLARDGEWRFFYRDFFTMFLRWNQPIRLIDGSQTMEPRLMRRKVRGQWQYRCLSASELHYILSIENGTHC